MTHPTLPAVDELADVRRTLAQLRQRELELCDEIRTIATDAGDARIDGCDRMAVIETRAARVLDMSKLPNEILNDPEVFVATPQAHVLLWPKTYNTRTVGDAAVVDCASPSVDLKEKGQPEFGSEPSEPTPKTADHAELAAEMEPAQSDPIFAEDSSTTSGPALQMPLLDAHKIAQTAKETAPPADLRPTRHVDLQPMGDLTEEDLETTFYEADQDLPAATDQEALLATQAQQDAFDTHIEACETREDEEAAAFMTRRIIGAPA